MIGAQDFRRAIGESFQEFGGDSRASLRSLGFDNRAVDERAERMLAFYSQSDTPPEAACKGAFVLGVELGYRIAKAERRA